MVSLDQVRLLESKVSKAIEYVQKVTDENKALLSERAALISKLDSSQKRLGELELLVMRFKEDQGRIEDGIMSALDRLSQFEEAFESSLASAQDNSKAEKQDSSAKKTAAKSGENPGAKKVKQESQPVPDSSDVSDEKEFFEIEDEENEDEEIEDDSKEGELDIF